MKQRVRLERQVIERQVRRRERQRGGDVARAHRPPSVRGSAYIRSKLTLPKIISAASAARRASSASCTRPSACRCASSKLWMPSDSRFTPAAKKPANFVALERPRIRFQRDFRVGQQAERARGRRTAADRSTTAENRLGVPPPMNTVPTLRPQIDGSALSRSATSASTYASSGSASRRLVRIEIAIRALAHAPRNVHVQRQAAAAR